MPNDTTITPVPTSPEMNMAPPNYEFDVYRLGPMCPEDDEEGGLGNEILGDVLIVCAQVCPEILYGS